MRQLMMQEKAITGARRFQTYFSPQELLHQRELAAGFLYQHFRYLSAVELYHTEVFYETVFGKTEATFPMMLPAEYASVLSASMELERGGQTRAVDQYFKQLLTKKRMQAFWKLAQATALDEVDQSKLYCLLMAGYSLADQTLEDCPISPEEAEKAYLRAAKKEEPEDIWLALAESGVITLEARQKPYRILLGQGAGELLKKGAVITHRKFLALPHAQGNSAVPVTLHLYASPEDKQYREVKFYAGDYRYANFVKNIPVFFHPVVQETPTCRAERQDTDFHYVDKRNKNKSELLRKIKFEIIGLAAEQKAAGCILLTDQGLEDYFYSSRDIISLPSENIVEAAFWGTECLLLDKFGRVHSTFHGLTAEGITALEELER